MKNIFVGNLSFQTTEDSLRSTFERIGKVHTVKIVTDRDTGRARGFAFVEMDNNKEAEQAIAELNGKNLDGRKITVNEAKPKPEKMDFQKYMGTPFRCQCH
jgi:RNA recognition motif-containing protein